MAKPERGVRSEAVRQYLKAHPKAGPQVVVDGLKADGIVVTKALVSSIKYGKRGKGKSRTRRTATRSEAIRGYFREHPTAAPKEVQAALARQGIKVKTGLISNVKHNFQKKGYAPTVRVAARRTKAGSVTVEQLIEVKRLSSSLGGLDQMRHALELLERFS